MRPPLRQPSDTARQRSSDQSGSPKASAATGQPQLPAQSGPSAHPADGQLGPGQPARRTRSELSKRPDSQQRPSAKGLGRNSAPPAKVCLDCLCRSISRTSGTKAYCCCRQRAGCASTSCRVWRRAPCRSSSAALCGTPRSPGAQALLCHPGDMLLQDLHQTCSCRQHTLRQALLLGPVKQTAASVPDCGMM